MDKNKLTSLLQIEHPIIQAPMAGGITTTDLVSSVSEAGGLGMVGAGYLTPIQLSEQIRGIKQRTSKPFGVNLFVPSPFTTTEDEIASAQSLLQPYYRELGLDQDQIRIPTYASEMEIFQKQVKIVADEEIPICSFTFGIPSTEVITMLKQKDILLIGTATSVEEAIINQEKGMDAIVVQGSEAGGHRGTFIGNMHGSCVGLMSLIPQVVDHVSVPVIAAGGIMDRRGFQAALCLGAVGVQMGTAFLTCVESGANSLHKEMIMNSKENDTALTRSFSGKYARGIRNAFINQMDKHQAQIPDYPIQNELTKALRRASGQQRNHEYMSLWAGQSPRLAKFQTVEQLILSLVKFF